MKLRTLRDQFAQIGARVMVEPVREMFRAESAVRLEVGSDHRGLLFHLMIDPLRVFALEAVDVRPMDGYLVLLVRQREFGKMNEAPKRLFVCGGQGSSLFVRDVLVPPPQNREGRVLPSMKWHRRRGHPQPRKTQPLRKIAAAPQQGQHRQTRPRPRSEPALSRK
jgi:hypothetical protein